MPPRPDSFYGVSKVAMESLGRLFADKFGLQVVCVRIGSFEEVPREPRHLSTWLSPADALAALRAAMTAPGLTYAAFYAVSRNSRRWWDLSAGAALGFDPRDNAEDYAGDMSVGDDAGPGELQSGAYTTPGFSLDRQR